MRRRVAAAVRFGLPAQPPRHPRRARAARRQRHRARCLVDVAAVTATGDAPTPPGACACGAPWYAPSGLACGRSSPSQGARAPFVVVLSATAVIMTATAAVLAFASAPDPAEAAVEDLQAACNAAESADRRSRLADRVLDDAAVPADAERFLDRALGLGQAADLFVGAEPEMRDLLELRRFVVGYERGWLLGDGFVFIEAFEFAERGDACA